MHGVDNLIKVGVGKELNQIHKEHGVTKVQIKVKALTIKAPKDKVSIIKVLKAKVSIVRALNLIKVLIKEPTKDLMQIKDKASMLKVLKGKDSTLKVKVLTIKDRALIKAKDSIIKECKEVTEVKVLTNKEVKASIIKEVKRVERVEKVIHHHTMGMVMVTLIAILLIQILITRLNPIITLIL